MSHKQSYQFQRFQQSIQRKQKSLQKLKWTALGILLLMIYLSYQMFFVPIPDPPAQNTPTNTSKIVDDIKTPKESNLALVWWLQSSKIPSNNELRDCLWGLGDRNVEVIGDQKGFLINRPKQKTPQLFSLQDGIYWLKTYLDEDLHSKITEHLYLAICLKSENAILKDPKNEREWQGDDWPRLGQNGGVNLNDVIEIQEIEQGLKTKGFEALGLKELMIIDQSNLAKTLIQNISVLQLLKPKENQFEWQQNRFALRASTETQYNEIIMLTGDLKNHNPTPKNKPKSPIKNKEEPKQNPVEIPLFKPDYQ